MLSVKRVGLTVMLLIDNTSTIVAQLQQPLGDTSSFQPSRNTSSSATGLSFARRQLLRASRNYFRFRLRAAVVVPAVWSNLISAGDVRKCYAV